MKNLFFFVALGLTATQSVSAQSWQYNDPAFALRFPAIQPEAVVGPLCAQYSIRACDDASGECLDGKTLALATSTRINVNSAQLIKSFNYISYYAQGTAVYQFLNTDPHFSTNVNNIHSLIVSDLTISANNSIGFPVICSSAEKRCYYWNASSKNPGYAGAPVLKLNLTNMNCPASQLTEKSEPTVLDLFTPSQENI